MGDLASFVSGGLSWRVLPADLKRVQEWCCAHFPSVLGESELLLKRSDNTCVVATEGLVLKERKAKPGVVGVRFGLRPSGARRGFVVGARLHAAGVSTPRPLAWGMVRRAGFRVADYIIQEEVEHAYELTYRLRGDRGLVEEKDMTLTLLGQLLGSFHGNGYTNRDMNDGNVLVTDEEGLRLWAVDMDGVRRRPLLTRLIAERDFWAVMRSLSIYGWDGAPDRKVLLMAYNSMVPLRLRREATPAFCDRRVRDGQV